MSAEELSVLLSKGIEAANQGDKRKAFDLLIKVVEQDRENETAWFWLSRAAANEEQKRICLENVLAVNPKNKAAIRDLDELTSHQGRNGEAGSKQIVNKEKAALTPAAAILYPERLVESWPEEEAVDDHSPPTFSFQSTSTYDDVWESDKDLCAFCAHPVPAEASRCPGCHRNLTSSRYSEPKASSNLIIFFVLILAVSQLFLIQVILDIILNIQPIMVVWHGLILSIAAILAVLAVIRHPAGYVGTIIFFIILLTLLGMEALTGSSVDSALATLAGVEYFQELAESPTTALAGSILGILRPFQMITIFLALLYGILAVGPDFEKSRRRIIASVDRGLFEASDFYTVGKRYQEHGMLASAVLHFRFAAAKEPARAYFLGALGFAYAELGFFERASDVLESALEVSKDPEYSQKIRERLASIRRTKEEG